jgi:hypothetical protein
LDKAVLKGKLATQKAEKEKNEMDMDFKYKDLMLKCEELQLQNDALTSALKKNRVDTNENDHLIVELNAKLAATEQALQREQATVAELRKQIQVLENELTLVQPPKRTSAYGYDSNSVRHTLISVYSNLSCNGTDISVPLEEPPVPVPKSLPDTEVEKSMENVPEAEAAPEEIVAPPVEATESKDALPPISTTEDKMKFSDHDKLYSKCTVLGNKLIIKSSQMSTPILAHVKEFILHCKTISDECDRMEGLGLVTIQEIQQLYNIEKKLDEYLKSLLLSSKKHAQLNNAETHVNIKEDVHNILSCVASIVKILEETRTYSGTITKGDLGYDRFDGNPDPNEGQEPFDLNFLVLFQQHQSNKVIKLGRELLLAPSLKLAEFEQLKGQMCRIVDHIVNETRCSLDVTEISESDYDLFDSTFEKMLQLKDQLEQLPFEECKTSDAVLAVMKVYID